MIAIPSTRCGALGAAAVAYPSTPPATSLIHWIKADTEVAQDVLFATPCAATNDVVGGWKDQSASAAHLIADGVSFGSYQLAAQNSRPGVRCASTYIWKSGFAGLSNAAAATLIICFKCSAPSGNNVIITFSDLNFGLFLNSSVLDAYVGGVGVSHGGFAWPNTSAHVVTVVYDGSLTGDTNRLKMWLDGSAKSLSTSGTVPATLGVHTDILFGERITGTLAFAGDIYESLVYSAALSTTNRNTAESYLKGRWATP